MVSTHSKNISQIASFPQIGMTIKNVWNHQLVISCIASLPNSLLRATRLLPTYRIYFSRKLSRQPYFVGVAAVIFSVFVALFIWGWHSTNPNNALCFREILYIWIVSSPQKWKFNHPWKNSFLPPLNENYAQVRSHLPKRGHSKILETTTYHSYHQ